MTRRTYNSGSATEAYMGGKKEMVADNDGGCERARTETKQ